VVYGGEGPVKSFRTLTAKVFRFYAPSIIVKKKVLKEKVLHAVLNVLQLGWARGEIEKMSM